MVCELKDDDQHQVINSVLYLELSSRLHGNVSDTYSTVKYVLDVYMSPVIIALGLTGNMLSVIVMLQKSLRKSSSTFLLCSLAITDNVVLITFLMRSWIMAAFGVDIRTVSTIGCKISLFLLYFGPHLSSWTLAFVTIERLVSVAWPLRTFDYCSRSRVIISWLAMVICLLLVNGHILWTADLMQFQSQPHCECAFDAKYFHFAYEIFPWVDFCVMVGTFIVLLVCNTAIVIILSRARRVRNRDMVFQSNQQNHDHVNGVTVMLISVSVVYILTTTPLTIYLLDVGLNVSQSLEGLISTILQILFCTNYSVNFFLYVLSGSRFRQALKSICTRQD